MSACKLLPLIGWDYQKCKNFKNEIQYSYSDSIGLNELWNNLNALITVHGKSSSYLFFIMVVEKL